MSIQHDLAAVVSINGEITVDAHLIAAHLGLTPEEMMAALRCGLVYQVAEKGTAADEGRIRLTFRYRAREYRIVVDASGAVVG
jgi:exonuclease I